MVARSARAIHAKLGTTRSRDALALQANHAEYLRNLGHHAETEAEFRQVIAWNTQVMAESDPCLLEARNGLALLFELRGLLPDAEAIVRDLVHIRRANLPAVT